MYINRKKIIFNFYLKAKNNGSFNRKMHFFENFQYKKSKNIFSKKQNLKIETNCIEMKITLLQSAIEGQIDRTKKKKYFVSINK